MEVGRVAVEQHTARRILNALLCDRRLRPTRVSSVRQLPTDHDYAVSTREYQADQPSQKLARSLPAPPCKRQKAMCQNQ